MIQRKKTKISKPLTEVELELMNVIWDLGECTVKEVQSALPEGRDLAYTSVATIIKILEQKKFVTREKKDGAHVYVPIVGRAEYEAVSLKHLADNVFRGDPSSMVVRLLSDGDLSAAELETIRALLKEKMERS